MSKYEHKKVEAKWQRKWEEESVNYPSDMDSVSEKDKFYNLWMFPYPSAEGLHAGHAFASTGSDIFGRFMRMNGKEVFQPIGYDSFGIHSENFAMKIGEHPTKMLKRTTKYYKKQLSSLGHGYDWTRTVTTSDLDYYRWTQWLFVQMFKAGLAYRSKSAVNWCPSCKTVLADEQVITEKKDVRRDYHAAHEGERIEAVKACERCGTEVETKELEQWFFRITDYADKLLENLSKIDWPENIKLAQRNWIGKKEGINITYQVKESDLTVDCWTSRPDTNFGATFVVVAPEHPKIMQLAKENYKDDVSEYVKDSRSRTKEDEIEEGREKTGVFTGSYAINQLTGEEIPIWVSDFALMEVGTGAVVGVPGHDRRDFEFAQKFNLPIKRVVIGSDGEEGEISTIEQVQEDDGKMVNSDFLNGMDIHEATKKMMDYMEEKGWGQRETNYHLRDWLISRQRYWGPPIPMIYCEKCAEEEKSWFTLQGEAFKGMHEEQNDWKHFGWWPVPEEQLPVELPDIKDFEPEGEGRGPLANHPDFYEVDCPECGSKAKRETDVSDTFLDSAWYFLRYPSVNLENFKKQITNNNQNSNNKSQISNKEMENGKWKMENLPWSPEVTRKWLPVDLYFGGAEHAVLHLMYARFVTMMLNDLDYVDFEEPFPKFFAHGLMIKDGAKMSKSRGNVVNPDEYIEKYGADTLRLYLMFMGPMDGYPDFRDTGIEGMRRFVDRVWDIFENYNDIVLVEEGDSKDVVIKMHQTIKKTTKDMQEFKYNTAIASIMEFVNLLRDSATKEGVERVGDRKVRCAEWDNAMKNLCLLLAPFAPHMTEEVWNEILGQSFSVHKAAWPEFNQEILKDIEIDVVVQVDGKVRDTIKIDKEAAKNKEKVIELTKESESVQKWTEGKDVKDTIFVPGRLVNFVTD